MGGSAFAAEMIAQAISDRGVPAFVVRGYTLPRPAARGDWLIAVSYSGDTEEVLSVFRQAGERGLVLMAVSSGGLLKTAAREVEATYLGIEPGFPPRAGAGLAFRALCDLACRTGGSGDLDPAVEDPARVAAHLESAAALWKPAVPLERNAAKTIATRLHGRLPFIYAGEGPPRAVLWRWATQINENAKAICHTALFPEQNHNEIVGWDGPDAWEKRACVVFLKGAGEDGPTARRLDVTRARLGSKSVPTLEVEAAGASTLLRLWWLSHLADYVSLYLAALREVDPTPVRAIADLKLRLLEDHP
jgi:glucose/mannose-6-phosphate isomerase